MAYPEGPYTVGQIRKIIDGVDDIALVVVNIRDAETEEVLSSYTLDLVTKVDRDIVVFETSNASPKE